MSNDDDYHDDSSPEKVGYGRPPRHSQFKKGQPSANPKGRPPKSTQIRDMFLEEMNAMVPVKIGGKTHNMAKSRVMLRRLSNIAAEGDLRAVKEVVRLYERFQPFQVPLESQEVIDKSGEIAKKMMRALDDLTRLKKAGLWPPVKSPNDDEGDGSSCADRSET